MSSWISNGQNESISPDQLGPVLGPDVGDFGDLGSERWAKDSLKKVHAD